MIDYSIREYQSFDTVEDMTQKGCFSTPGPFPFATYVYNSNKTSYYTLKLKVEKKK